MTATATITYTSDLADVAADQLVGFFEGWPTAPSPDTHLAILLSSSYAVIARDGSTVVGVVTALSDGILAAYVPLLEVRADYRGQGIGSELVRRVLAHFSDLYMVDLLCDSDLQPFYARLGFEPATGAAIRAYVNQAGRAPAAVR